MIDLSTYGNHDEHSQAFRSKQYIICFRRTSVNITPTAPAKNMRQLDDMSESLAQSNIKDMSTTPEMTTTNADGGIALTAATELAMDPTTSTAYPKNITIDVGGRKFKTSLATLRDESDYFKAQLSDSWEWSPEEDGSYFLDADPDLFAHLLTFMRRPGTFPLFYDLAKGFDYDLYNKLEAEAEYFQVRVLHEWIKSKKYLQAFKTKITSATLENVRSTIELQAATSKGGEVRIIPCTRQVYLCPRQIIAHRGRGEQCGRACHECQEENVVVYEDEPYWQVLSFEKETVLDEKVCKF